MMKEYDETLDALALNPVARVACAVVCDCSRSMSGSPIEQLNHGLGRFLAAVRADDAVAMSSEIAVVAFASEARLEHGFAPIDGYPEKLPRLTASGCTATGPALKLAEQLLDERLALYRRAGIPHYAPWLLLLTDGRPYPDTGGWKDVAARLKQRAAIGKLNYLCVGVGDDIDEQTLAALSPAEPGVLRLEGFKFQELFVWLSTSLHAVSVAGVGNEGEVRLGGIESWSWARFAKKGGR